MAQFLGAKGFRDLQEDGPHPDARPGARFSKVPETFRACKAIFS